MKLKRLFAGLVVLLGLCGPACAVVAVDATGTSDLLFDGGASPQAFNNLTIGSGTCLLGILLDASGSNISSVAATWNSVSMTAITSATTTDNNRVYLFGLLNPTTGNHTLSFSWAGPSMSGYADAISFTGCDTSSFANAFRNSAGAAFAATVANPTLAVTLNGSGDIAAGGFVTGGDNITSIGPTQIFLDTGGNSGNGAASRGTGTSSVTLTSGGVGTTSTKAWAGVDVAAPGGAAGCPATRALMGVGC